MTEYYLPEDHDKQEKLINFMEYTPETNGITTNGVQPVVLVDPALIQNTTGLPNRALYKPLGGGAGGGGGNTTPPIVVETETTGFEACYFDGVNDIPSFVKIVDNEDGTLKEYIISYLDGSGTTITQADLSNIKKCAVANIPLEMCDTLEAVISGDLAFTLAGNGVVVDTTGVLFANDSVRFFWTDFGNGFSDVGNNPSIQYFSDGNYEIKVYAVMASGNKILLYAKEVVVTNGVAVLQGVNPQPVTLNYDVAVGSVYQYFNSVGLPVGTPFNTDGTPYTVVGTLLFECPNIIDDLEDNAEYNGTANAQLALVKTVIDGTGTIVVATGYKSASVTALSADVTIDGVPVPEGFSWSVDSSRLERFADIVTVTGTKYILTEVR